MESKARLVHTGSQNLFQRIAMITLHGGDGPSFDAPLDMLTACHDKVRRFCTLLDKLPAHLATHGVDRAARDAAAGVLRYFDVAGPLHHQDEEDELFPLLAMRDADAATGVARLRAEHRELAALWQRVRAMLLALDAGDATALDAALAGEFAARYRAHAADEEAWLFPLAARLMSAQELEDAGRRMAARRQA